LTIKILLLQNQLISLVCIQIPIYNGHSTEILCIEETEYSMQFDEEFVLLSDSRLFKDSPIVCLLNKDI